MSSDAASKAVKAFVQGVRRLLRSGTIEGRASLVELVASDVPRLHKTYFQDKAWPTAQQVAEWLDNDTLVALLYKELTQRHVLKKSFSAALAASQFDTYIMLFDLFLGRSQSSDDEWAAWTVQLPFAWMWQLVSGFTDLCIQLWNKADSLLDEPATAIKQLTQRPAMLTAQTYVNYLEALVVHGALAQGMQCSPSVQAVRTGAVPMAFFALLGQARIYMAAGDFEKANETLKLLNSHRRLHTPFASVIDARAALAYTKAMEVLLGQRRPGDALRFTQTNLRNLLKADPKDKDVSKKSESVYKLLALAALLPHMSGKHVYQVRDGLLTRRVRENFGGAQFRGMQAGHLPSLLSTFQAANLVIPPLGVSLDTSKLGSAVTLQMQHVEQREAQFSELAALALICARVGNAVQQYDSLSVPKLQGKLAAVHAKQQLLQARLGGDKKSGVSDEVKASIKQARVDGKVDETQDLDALLATICDDVDGFVSVALERTFEQTNEFLQCQDTPQSSVRTLQSLIVSMNRFDGILKQLQRV